MKEAHKVTQSAQLESADLSEMVDREIAPVRKKPGPKKSATVKKSVPAKATKRVISAETRKKMSDAAKARAAKKASAVK